MLGLRRRRLRRWTAVLWVLGRHPGAQPAPPLPRPWLAPAHTSEGGRHVTDAALSTQAALCFEPSQCRTLRLLRRQAGMPARRQPFPTRTSQPPCQAHLLCHRRNQALSEGLLRLQARRQALGDARQLGQAQHHAVARHVRDVAAPVERQQRVLAQRGKRDVTHDDQAVAAGAHNGLVKERGAKGAAGRRGWVGRKVGGCSQLSRRRVLAATGCTTKGSDTTGTC